MGGEQVGLQGGAGDGRAGGAAGGGQGRVESVDVAEQVAVPVEEGPVHGGSAGDARHGDLGAVAEGVVECGDEALPATCGVGLPAFPHRLGARARRPGRGGRGGAGHARASLAGEGVVTWTDGMPRDTARCLRITVTASSTWARSAPVSWVMSPLIRPMSRRIRVISSSAGVAPAPAPSSPPPMAAARRYRVGSKAARDAGRAG